MWLTDGQTDGRTPYHNTPEVMNGKMESAYIKYVKMHDYLLVLKNAVRRRVF